MLGDGGKQEVVERLDGSTYLTPNKDTVSWLNTGDSVYSSVDEYNKTMMNRGLNNRLIGASKQNQSVGVRDEIRKGFKNVKIQNKNVINNDTNDIDFQMWRERQLSM